MFYITSGFKLCFLFAVAIFSIFTAIEERSILWTMIALVCSIFFIGGFITWFGWIITAISHTF